MKMTRQLPLADFIYMLMSMLARLVSALATFAVMLRTSPEYFGHFAYLQSTALMIGTVVTASVQNTIVSPLIEQRCGSRTHRAASTLATVYSLVVSSIIFCLVYVYQRDFLVALMFFLAVLNSTLYGWLQGISVALRRKVLAASIPLVAAFSLLILYAVGSVDDTADIVTFYCLAAAGSATYAIIILFRISKPAFNSNIIVRFSKEVFVPVLKYGAVISVGSILTNFVNWYQQHNVIQISGGQENAYFAAGLQIYNLLIFIPILAMPLVISRLARSDNFSDIFKRAAIWIGLCLTCCAASVAGFLVVVNELPHIFLEARDSILTLIVSAWINCSKVIFSGYCAVLLIGRAEFAASILSAFAVFTVSLMIPAGSAELASFYRLLMDSCYLLVLVLVFIYWAPKVRDR